jgi:hypothetical protein
MTTNNRPLQLSNSLSLYSGDIITINNSNPWLVEIIDNQSIKLRKLDKSEYLYKSKGLFTKAINSLRFSSDTKKFSVFAIAQGNDDKVSFKTDGEYLDFNNDKFSLSPQKQWLIIAKQEDVKEITNYQEEIEIFEFHENKAQKIIDKRAIIACKSHNNKTNETLEYTFELAQEVRKEHNFTYSKEITLGTKAKLSIATSVGLNISGNCERKTTTSNSITKTETETIKDSLKVNCAP